MSGTHASDTVGQAYNYILLAPFANIFHSKALLAGAISGSQYVK